MYLSLLNAAVLPHKSLSLQCNILIVKLKPPSNPMTHFTLTPAHILDCLKERCHFKAQWMKICCHQIWAVRWTSIHHALVCKWLLVCFFNNRFLRFTGSGRRVSFQNKVTVLSLKGNHHLILFFQETDFHTFHTTPNMPACSNKILVSSEQIICCHNAILIKMMGNIKSWVWRT